MNDPAKLTAFNAPLIREFATSLVNFLDADLTPPTKRQLAFAKSQAYSRGLHIPREALMYRSEMFVFLSKHAPKKK